MIKHPAITPFPPPPLGEVEGASYKRRLMAVRTRLVALQFRLGRADFPVLIVFGGVDGGGKHEAVNRLHEWLDPRNIDSLAYVDPTSAEAERPRLWRYWRDLPARGRIGLVLSGWYSQPLLDFVYQRSDAAQFEHQLQQVCDFERTLVNDGALILKFWLHLSAEQQRKRLRSLAADPLTRWQIRPRDWRNLQLYQRFVYASRQLIEGSNRAPAQWQVFDGSDPRASQLRVAEALADALENAIEGERPAPKVRFTPTRRRRLETVDLGVRLGKTPYRERLKAAQAELLHLQQLALQNRRATVLVLEGWDAAGKGGVIRRLVQPLDARLYKVNRIAAPNDEEHGRHYLWRFWRQLPRAGHLCVFDRSWYGRVLVERVEGLAHPPQWQRAYREINEFERVLTDAGVHLLKFWLHISDEEQLARFEARRADPLKRWKLTDEDWRNREQRAAYNQAVEDMLARCSHREAPWILSLIHI